MAADQTADEALRNWEQLRSDDAIQFAPVQMPETPPPPSWLQDFMEWLARLFGPVAEALGGIWPILKYTLLAAALLCLLWLLWKLVEPMARIRLEKRRQTEADEVEWTPERTEALALLEEADRLAQSGLFDEATHLLLRRSVWHISSARPDWLEPSSTAREIASLPALPERARSAFSIIAERVERSLFALRPLNADDWEAARNAYAEFALADFRQDQPA